ncbi:pyruvate synthase subunit PorC [Paenibacillus larvae subsp. larvae]|uniref:Ferredoxin n=2 Tax=Paenibacillus larvae TaxID=1464 RepID=A0A1U9YN76_9BACL|nr:2-oxoacid:acceptor oxidoreductase family protein [Paenibacillus larvae]AQT84877.1 ferredoxin [Paenibacillus larvae subsp. pulvifaciens]AQZ46875.1 ferredoxin [Paenibacillus larvae subsp. pulvifaciens]ARF68256.1 ferredoxin [Paenibacillus larvae subsp. pulvifaciens]AVF28643.1 pyruvate synthase subunit PorC [Paenibacillus larvae subsp. larvae]AVF33148.1 pyruvate synthase subunit PorC [Paenibacillus larvae subsp. larvae]
MQHTKLSRVNELGLFEIRLESIGGLGANLAGKMLAEAGVLHLGLNGSNFSSYGSEKKGSAVKAFIRFSDPHVSLRASSPIDHPHVVAVFHEALLTSQNCVDGLDENGLLLVNTTQSPEKIRDLSGFNGGTILCVDALGISIREKTRINTAMLGALCRAVDFLSPEVVKTVIRQTFEAKYPALVEANLRTFEAGYEEIISRSFAPEDGFEGGPVQNAPVFGYETQPIGGVILNPGNTVFKDLSTSRQGFLPVFNQQDCINCAACDQSCPDFCFVWAEGEDKKGRKHQFLQGIDYQYCKGCLKCVEACPTTALSKGRETEGYAGVHAVKQKFSLLEHV